MKEKNINGIIAGISEFNLIKAMKLYKINNLDFLFNMEQWKKISHKHDFRELCNKFNVSSPKTYYIGEEIDKKNFEDITYLAIVKPVDANTSRGVFVCKDIEELLDKSRESIKESGQGKIIVEEFVYGDEFTAHYTIVNGKASLYCMDNRYPVKVNEGNVTTIPVARLYPSSFLDSYMKKVDKSMLELCEGIGLRNSVLFIQGIYNEELDKFWIFEAGLRGAAESPNRIIKDIKGNDYFNILVDHVLNGESDYDISKNTPDLEGKTAGVVSLVSTGGVVGKIEGIEEVRYLSKNINNLINIKLK